MDMMRFTIRLDKDLHSKLREESYLTNKSMNQILLELVEEHYKKEEK